MRCNLQYTDRKADKFRPLLKPSLVLSNLAVFGDTRVQIWAVMHSDFQMTDILVGAGAQLDTRSKNDGDTSLHVAVG